MYAFTLEKSAPNDASIWSRKGISRGGEEKPDWATVAGALFLARCAAACPAVPMVGADVAKASARAEGAADLSAGAAPSPLMAACVPPPTRNAPQGPRDQSAAPTMSAVTRGLECVALRWTAASGRGWRSCHEEAPRSGRGLPAAPLFLSFGAPCRASLSRSRSYHGWAISWPRNAGPLLLGAGDGLERPWSGVGDLVDEDLV